MNGLIKQWGSNLSYEGDVILAVNYSEDKYNIFLQSSYSYPNRSFTGTLAQPKSSTYFHYTFRYGTGDTGTTDGMWFTIGY